MRHISSCTECRSRKKRCVVLQKGHACSSCVKKRWTCDFADDTGRAADNDPRPASYSNNNRHSPPHELESRQTKTEPSRPGLILARNEPQSEITIPPYSVCNELVDLYFDLIEGKQLLLLHHTTFITAQRAGRAPNFLILGIIALMARFSSNPYFEKIHPWHRARHWFKASMQSFNSRTEPISLAALQGCILLAFVALAEGDSHQEALLLSQAICMVRVLGLPVKLDSNPIQREVQIRVFWEMWMTENWYAARALIPKQLMDSPTFKRPIEEAVYRDMKEDDSPEKYSERNIEASGLRDCGLWTWMIPLSEFHDQVMRLNDAIVQNTVSEDHIRQEVKTLSNDIEIYFMSLPGHLQHTPENWDRHTKCGFGREFTILQLNYHHQCQMLYYQFLKKGSATSVYSADQEAERYAEKCKKHATALSQVMWNANSCAGMECTWSPINGHLLVVSSSVLIYSLLFDTDEESIIRAKKLLEQNFIMLLQLRRYWALVELSMARLRAFHKACQMNSTQQNFDMDHWMVYFLNRYDANVSERYEDGIYGSGISDTYMDLSPMPDYLWLELSENIATRSHS